MPTPYEEMSQSSIASTGKPDSNLSNDSNKLGGIEAEDYATKEYVKKYHDTKEANLKKYIDDQGNSKLNEAKEYANSMVRNQDFSGFAKNTDVTALKEKLENDLSSKINEQKKYTDTKIKSVVDDTNSNFNDVNTAITKLNDNQQNLFQSVSSGKAKIAGAITDKGVTTSANDSFDTMSNNIRAITTGGTILEGYVNTSDADASSSDILLGKSAYVKGQKVYGSHICQTGYDTSDATATPYDILLGKSAYGATGKIDGVLQIESGVPSYSIGSVEKIYGTSDIYKNSSISQSFQEDLYFTNAYTKMICDTNGNVVGLICFDTSTNTIKLYTYSTSLIGGASFSNVQTYNISDIIGEADSYQFRGITTSTIISEEGYVAIMVNKTFVVLRLFLYEEVLGTGTNGGKLSKYYLKLDTDKLYKKEFTYVYSSLTLNYGNMKFVENISKSDTYKAKVIIVGCSDVDENVEKKCNVIDFIRILDFYNSSDGSSTPQVDVSEARNSITKDYAGIDYVHKIDIINNGRLVYFSYNNGLSGGYNGYYVGYCFLDENFNFIKMDVLSDVGATSNRDDSMNECFTATANGKYIIWRSNLYSTTINYNTYKINASLIKDISDIKSITCNYNKFSFSVDGTKLYQIKQNDVKYSAYIKIYKCTDTGTNIDFSELYSLEIPASNSSISIRYVENGQILAGSGVTFVYNNNAFNIVKVAKDYSEVIGLLYNGDHYYKVDNTIITAVADDVRSGKTFIGKSGNIETGTLEVQ